MSPASRLVYQAIELRFNGSNNSKVLAGSRDLADETGMAKSTVLDSLHDLQRKGFVKVARRGSFGSSGGHAALYELTRLPPNMSGQPTREYERWAHGQEHAVNVSPRQSKAGRSSQTER